MTKAHRRAGSDPAMSPCRPGTEVFGCLQGSDAKRRPEQRYVEMTALPRLLRLAQGGSDAERRVQACGEIGERHAAFDRRLPWLTSMTRMPFCGAFIVEPISIRSGTEESQDSCIPPGRMTTRRPPCEEVRAELHVVLVVRTFWRPRATWLPELGHQDAIPPARSVEVLCHLASNWPKASIARTE